MTLINNLVKNAICGNAPEWLINAFRSNDINLISVGTTTALLEPVAHHIDMMALKLPDSSIMLTPETQKLLSQSINSHSISTPIIVTEEHLNPGYPNEILLNCAIFDDFVVCNKKYTSQKIIEYAKLHNLEIINTNQGYCNCSLCQIGGNAFITEDESIYNLLSKRIPGLLIKKGEVNLPGYDYGFIGGATAFYDDTVYFFGCISKHPDYPSIKSFIEDKNFKLCELSNKEPLTDIGGVIFI